MKDNATGYQQGTGYNGNKQPVFMLPAPAQAGVRFIFFTFLKIMEIIHKYGAEKQQQQIPVNGRRQL